MKPFGILSALFSILVFASCQDTKTYKVKEEVVAETTPQFYQLKVYTFDTEDQVKTTDEYLKDAFLPAIKKIGFGPVGVFKQRITESDSTLKTYVLIPLSSFGKVLEIEEKLENDAAHAAAGSAYLEASHKQPPYKRIESTLLKGFEEMPTMQTPELDGNRADRVYELRSYESATEKLYKNKVDMFNAGGEVKLFDRLGFNAVFYGEVVSGSQMPNLMYMTTFSNQEVRDSLWKEFFASPEWEVLKADPKYKNNVSHADKIFLYPTEYSDY